MKFYPTYVGFPYPYYKYYVTYAKSNPKTDFEGDCKILPNNLFQINLGNSVRYSSNILYLRKHNSSEDVFKEYKIRGSNKLCLVKLLVLV